MLLKVSWIQGLRKALAVCSEMLFKVPQSLAEAVKYDFAQLIPLRGDCRLKSTTMMMMTQLLKPMLTQPRSAPPLTLEVQMRPLLFRHTIEGSRRKPPRPRPTRPPNMRPAQRHSLETVPSKATTLTGATWLQLVLPTVSSSSGAYNLNLRSPLGASALQSLPLKCLTAMQKRKQVQQAAYRRTVLRTDWSSLWEATQSFTADICPSSHCQNRLQCSQPGHCRHSMRPRLPLQPVATPNCDHRRQAIQHFSLYLFRQNTAPISQQYARTKNSCPRTTHTNKSHQRPR